MLSFHWTLWYLIMFAGLIIFGLKGFFIFSAILVALILLALCLIYTDKKQKNDPE